ncbi:hypothetical protein IFM89_022258 [Coptis chinensis]|uniref:Uncharacterized protein n=1 Tax=Coptis chinensis TaxID=261450 RepID=A0A835HGF3_9MAGN|nr:hypothetical protein IFM89_022258 [Coptis chinensis]
MDKTQRITFTPYHHPTRQFSLYSIVTISTTNDKKRYISCSAGGKTVDEPVDVKQGEKVWESRKRLRIVDVKRGLDEGLDWLGKKLVVKGWVRTLRVQSSVTFLKVESGIISTGASVWVEGVVLISQGSKQKVELNVGKVITVARVRNALAYATHKFFQENGFVWVSSPSITASDCEGAEEQFCVTKLILCDL